MFDKVSKSMKNYLEIVKERNESFTKQGILMSFIPDVIKLECKLEKSIALNEELVKHIKDDNSYEYNNFIDEEKKEYDAQIQQYKDRINKLKEDKQ